MVKQVIDQHKLLKLKLSQDEKEMFFDFVNMLPKGVYNKSNMVDFAFLEAIRKDDYQVASDYLQRLSWNRVALKILSYVRKNKTYQSEEDKQILIKDFNSIVESHYSNHSPCKIISCSNCGEPISSEEKVCLYCGSPNEEEM